MHTERINTVSGEELLNMELPPIKFVVDGFLAQGLSILSGMAKIGKSWMLLKMCLCIANGEKFWNYDTHKGTVLYLCLEDSYNRIQHRLLCLTEDAPANLFFATAAKTLDDGLCGQISMFIDEHPDTNLVVIDIFQKVRSGGGDFMYASDYNDVVLLKSLADKYSISILCVHHVRKMTADDPHMTVSGSTGLTGAADCSYVLMRTSSDTSEAKLYIRGRDVEEKVLSLTFDSANCEWRYEGGDDIAIDTMKSDPVMKAVTDYILDKKEFSGTASELGDALSLPVNGSALSKKLNKYDSELKREGITITRTRTGERREIHLCYTPPDS